MLGLAVLYALLILLVLSSLTTEAKISPVWLPSGLGLAALIVGGKKYWPGIFLGALAAYLEIWRSVPISFFIAASNVLEALSAVWLLSLIKTFDSGFKQPRDYLWLILAGSIAAMLATTIGVTTLVFADVLPMVDILHAWGYWVMGNLLGIALGAPFLLIWRKRPSRWIDKEQSRWLELSLFSALALLTSLIAFHGWTSPWTADIPMGYLMYLFVTWAAIRLGRHGVTLVLLLTAVQGVLGALDGVGFFASDIQRGLMNFWLYMISLSLVGVVLESTIRQHRRDGEALRESEARWSFALEGGGDCVWDWNVQSNEVLLSKGGKSMFGFADDEIGNDMSEWNARVHPDDIVSLLGRIGEFFHSKSDKFSGEYRVRCKDESWKWILTRGMVAHRSADGKVTRMIGTHTDLTERKMAEETIRRQAHYDALTQLPNRRLFRDRLEQTIRLSRRDHSSFALMLIDLDHFKEVNDTMGHDAGDLLLVDAAQRIQQCVRESDTVARMGGDEFVVILPDIHEQASIERIAQSIIAKLVSPFLLGEEKAFISASVGITLFPADADTMEALLKNADQAMYVAKQLGRNRFSYFTPVLQENAQKRMRLVNDLRDALASEQFRVYYQPIVELATGDIHKAEALIRWMHPRRGMVNPAEFIPLAEETGLIVEIGDWVLRQAMHQVKRLQASHHRGFQISVNKSPVQFHNDNPVKAAEWLSEMRQNGLQASSLVVEITEGVLLDDNGNVKDRLLASRDAGIQLAIDDFGTGYSSLAYLKKFDIDYLKIDQSFVNNLGTQSDDMALCEAIIVMAHKLGLKVIAEGVETGQQRDLLKRAGCDYAQGFLFSRAIPAEELEALLLKNRA